MVNNSTLPVLILPSHIVLKAIKKVIFATNYENYDINALTYLANLARIFGFSIEVIHVDVFKTKAPELSNELLFKRFVNGLNVQGVTYYDIKGKDVVKRLNKFCKESGADILAIVHYHQGFFARVFGTCDTEKELAHQQNAVMIFTENFISK